MEHILKILTSQALGNGGVLLIVLTLYLVILFRKALFRHLAAESGLATKEDLHTAVYGLATLKDLDGLATLKDLDALAAKLEAQIQHSRLEFKADLQQLKDNDLKHIQHDLAAGDAALRHELDYKLDALRQALDLKLELLRKQLDALQKNGEERDAALRKDLEAGHAALRHELEGRDAALRQTLDLKLELILNEIKGNRGWGMGDGEEKETF